MTNKGYYIATKKGYEIKGDIFEGLLRAINDINNRLTDLEEWHRNVIEKENKK